MERRPLLQGLLALLAVPFALLKPREAKPLQPKSDVTLARLADFFAMAEGRAEHVQTVTVDENDYEALKWQLRAINKGDDLDLLWGARIRKALASNQNGYVHLVSDKAHYVVHWDRPAGHRFLRDTAIVSERTYKVLTVDTFRYRSELYRSRFVVS